MDYYVEVQKRVMSSPSTSSVLTALSTTAAYISAANLKGEGRSIPPPQKKASEYRGQTCVAGKHVALI